MSPGLFALLACRPAPSPVNTAALVAEAISRQDAGVCAQVPDPHARGECQLAAGAACEAIQAGIFQNECWFQRAESLEDEDTAAQTCALAGPYAEDCYAHLFQDFTNRDLARSSGRFDEDLAVARARAERYAELGAGEWRPPWGWLWRRFFEEQARIDLEACAPYAEEDLRRCERGATSMLRLSWRRELANRPRTWCGLSLRELHEQAPPGLAWQRHPALDELVLEELQACEG